MDEAAIQRVVTFSTYLRKSIDVILEKDTALSLDSWLLYEIQETFSQFVDVDRGSNFHVLPSIDSDYPSLHEIQFLYDVLQKIVKLKLMSKPCQNLPIEQQISLSCFRNLHSLSLHSIPVSQVRGLVNLRTCLLSLTVTEACGTLNEVLSECGVDEAPPSNWEQLETANFSRNPLTFLDNSLHLLSRIKVLDLSYCHLMDIEALQCLPTIENLNLSFNKITSIPILSSEASVSLRVLNVANNLVVDLKGVNQLLNITELKANENLICIEGALVYLKDLPQLRFLNLLRNPISFKPNYRNTLLKYLHPHTSMCQELRLDDVPVMTTERKLIGTADDKKIAEQNSSSGGFHMIKFLTESVSAFVRFPRSSSNFSLNNSLPTNLPMSRRLSASVSRSFDGSSDSLSSSIHNLKSTTKESVKKKRTRRNVTRHISISDPPEAYVPHLSPIVDDQRKDENEELEVDAAGRLGFGANSEENSDSLDVSYLSNSKDFSNCSNSEYGPSQSDKLLEEILFSHSNLDTGEVVTSSPLTSAAQWNPQDKMTTRDTRTFSQLGDSSDDPSGSPSSFRRVGESVSRQLSVDSSAITTQDEGTREVLSVSARLYDSSTDYSLIDSSSDTESSRCDSSITRDTHEEEAIFLSFTDKFYFEKKCCDGPVLLKVQWGDLLAVTRMSSSPSTLSIVFKDSKTGSTFSRNLIIEEIEFSGVYEYLMTVLEQNKGMKSHMNFQFCRGCSLPIGSPVSSPSNGQKDGLCTSSGFCVPSFLSSRTGAHLHGHTRSYSDVNVLSLSAKINSQDDTYKKKYSSDRSESVSLCSSSGGVSETSGSQPKVTPDRISTQSASSIEVLSEPCLDNEESCDQNPYLKSFADLQSLTNFASPEVSELVSQTTQSQNHSSIKDRPIMQESSSSGSMSGSACTTVDRSAGLDSPFKVVSTSKPDRANNRSNGMSLKEVFSSLSAYDSERKGIVFGDPTHIISLGPWLKPLQGCYASFAWEMWSEDCHNDALSGSTTSLTSQIHFNFADFRDVHHRIKLYCEVFLFSEQHETLLGLVKAIVKTGLDLPYLGVFAVSNRKVYVFKLNVDRTDAMDEMLLLVTSCYLHQISSLETLFFKQGFQICLQGSLVLVLMSDPEVTSAFIRFIIESLEGSNVFLSVDDSGARRQSEKLRQLLSRLGESKEGSRVHLFQAISSLRDGGLCENHFMVMTDSQVVLFQADLDWFAPTSCADLVVSSMHSIDDITQIQVFSSHHLQVDFYRRETKLDDDPKFPWRVHVGSAWVCCNIIASLRPLWSKVFNIELDIVCYQEELLIIEQILKGTPFEAYVKKDSFSELS